LAFLEKVKEEGASEGWVYWKSLPYEISVKNSVGAQKGRSDDK
jgi:hypothetical protein